MKRTSFSTLRAFTLIELLVVIAIIAILSAILFPVFAKVREKARQTTCMSNEKQIGLGIMEYVQDYDELYPGGAPGAVANAQPGMGWAGDIAQYVKSIDLFHCPDDTGAVTGVYNGHTYYPISYGMNEFIGNEPQSYVLQPSSVVLLSEVGQVSVYLNYTDEGVSEVGGSWIALSPVTTGYPVNGCGNGCGGTDTLPGLDIYAGATIGNGVVTGTSQSVAYNATGGPQARHSVQTSPQAGQSMYLMADGHVKFMQSASVSSGWNTPVCVDYMSEHHVAATFNPGDYTIHNGGPCN